MPCLRGAAAIVVALAAAAVGDVSAHAAAGSAPSYRIFLTDGTPLLSYGEFARVHGRVVFTVPIGSPASPDALQVVSLPESVVDWERTTRYTDAVRFQQYAMARGEDDYAALTGAVARALGDMAYAADPAAKLAIAGDIRRQLLEWPGAHLAYRSADVRELTARVEEAVSEIRAGSGQQSFDLSLVAMIEPPSEPLLPEPSVKDSLDYARTIASMTDSRRERLTLQQNILEVLQRRKPLVPRGWYSAARKELASSVERERNVDRDYAELSSHAVHEARHREADADVRGLERLAAEVGVDDRRLGQQRPEVMQALLASLAASTDRAKARREAIDRYKYRKSAFKTYHSRVDDSLGKFDDVASDLGVVKAQKGMSARRVSKAERRVAAIEVSLLPAEPPGELKATHDLLISSARLMREALRLQRGAASGDAMAAQNASAAAAGALLLLETARNRIDEFFRPPSAP